MWRLIGIQGNHKGRFFDLDTERLILGKEESCGICLNEDGTIAGEQAELVLCNGNYMYRDMDSQCSTVLNGNTIVGMTLLRNGDTIQIGDSIFRIENTNSEQTVSPTNTQITSSPPKTNDLAVVSLVMSIIIPLVGLILGIVSYKQIKRSEGKQTGEGFAIAGMMISSVFVLYISLLLFSIAIPNFIRAREMSRAKVCINNLVQLDVAKRQWALDNRATDGDAIMNGMADLCGASKYIKDMPSCPAGGTYTIGNIGAFPTCSIPGHYIRIGLPPSDESTCPESIEVSKDR